MAGDPTDEAPATGDGALTPTRLAWYGAAMVLIGIVLAWAGTALALDVAGLVVGGIGSVVLISAVFLAIGQSEDRDRERRPSGG